MKFKNFLTATFALCILLSGCTAGELPAESTQPATNVTAVTEPTEPIGQWEQLLTYAEYLEMNTQERSKFADSFEDSADFFRWLQAVKAIYEQERKDNELGQNGIIDMEEVNPNG